MRLYNKGDHWNLSAQYSGERLKMGNIQWGNFYLLTLHLQCKYIYVFNVVENMYFIYPCIYIQ